MPYRFNHPFAYTSKTWLLSGGKWDIPSSHMSWTQHDSFWLLDDRGQTLRRFLAFFFLCAHFLLRLDDDVNRPLSTSFLLLGILGELALILIHLLLCWGPDGPQTLGRGHLSSCCWTVSLQLVSSAALWAGLLHCTMETKDITCQLKANTKQFCRHVCSYGCS